MKQNPELTELQLRFEKMKEVEFTRRVLIPLFKAIGLKTDDYGGAYEEGKDIIFWETNAFEEQECGVAQVKKLKPRVSTRDEASFSDLCNQLQQATEKEIPGLDGQSHLPKRVLFITPYNVDVRALQSRFEKYRELSSRRVAVFDGTRIATLLLQKCPEIARDLLGHEVSVATATLMHLSNDALMSALRAVSSRDVDQFYCGLDFAFGRQGCHFFNASIKDSFRGRHVVTELQLERLSELHHTIYNSTGISLILDSEASLLEQKKQYIERLQIAADIHLVEIIPNKPTLSEKIFGKATAGEKCKEETWCSLADQAWKEYEIEKNHALKQIDRLANEISKIWFRLFFRILDALRNGQGQRDKLFEYCYTKLEKRNARLRVLRTSELDRLYITANCVRRLMDQRRMFLNDAPKLEYSVQINSVEIADWIRSKRLWVAEQVKRINSLMPSNEDLKAFISATGKLLKLADNIFARPEFTEFALNLDLQERKARSFGVVNNSTHDVQYVIHCPIDAFFATRLNFAVFGNAGAGKTTTLQVYAKKLIEKQKGSLVLFVPLASAVAIFRRKSAGAHPVKKDAKQEAVDKLLQALTDYVNQLGKGANISSVKLSQLLNSANAVVLLDGVDEVVKACPWIFEAINELPSVCPKAQIIVSSRHVGGFPERIQFIGISIRDFTDEQKNEFIKKWFAVDGKTASIADTIIKHLEGNKAIAEIVNNPLNATILCVLAENGISLPEREIQLYKERMRLLCGDYDIHKEAQRIESRSELLNRVAVKLAYYLHSHSLREESFENLLKEALRVFKGRVDPDRVKAAVSELIDPCNMLLPMNAQGDLGFGHLRFQEFLTACELLSNRNIKLSKLLYGSWWRGPLVLLSQMTDDLEFLFRAAVSRSQLKEALPTLNAMMKDKSEVEIARLDKWIEECELSDYDDDPHSANQTSDDATPFRYFEDQINYPDR